MLSILLSSSPARACAALLVLASSAAAQSAPELLYYTFDEGAGSTTANLASPGAGANPATVNGHMLAAAGGQFAGGLVGVGGPSSTSFVDTGFPLVLPGDFTVGFSLDLTGGGGGSFMYVMGGDQNTANGFRCFTNGAAGANGIILRQDTGLADTIIPGGADPAAPHVVAWVYDSSVPEIRGYLDGVLVNSVAQPAFTIAGPLNLKVGGHWSSTSMAAGAVMDEFRLYDRALSTTEIAATWNITLGGGGTTTYCTAKTNSLGCVPAISGNGIPSASATSGFTIDCAMVRNGKSGLLFYKANGAQANLTFQCGTLCVGPSGIKRTPAQSAGGNPPPANDCSGIYSLDMNAFAAGLAGGNPDPALSSAGTLVHCQWWGRDQGFPAPCNTTLSDGAEYTIQP